MTQAHPLETVLDLSSSNLRRSGCAQVAFERTKCTFSWGHKKTLLQLHLCRPPQIRQRWLGKVCWGPSPFLPAAAWLPRPPCRNTLSASVGGWRGRAAGWVDGWMAVAFCHVSWHPTGLVLGPRVGPAATRRCNFTAFYLKTALSQEKRELLGMTVASGNPGEDRVGGKNHRRGPELGRAWRVTAALSVTGCLRPRPS